MVYVRRSRKTSSYRRRTPYRRRTYRKRRFSRKRFARNNVNQLTMRAPLAPRLLRVKLPWIFTEDNTIVANQSVAHSFQGSGLVPWTSNGNSASFNNYQNVSAGDNLPAGAMEYSRLYDKYYVNGSSIKVEAITTENFQGVVRAVLLAVPFETNPGNDLDLDTYPAVRSQLDGYTYEQLLAWPYAKWRMIGTAEGGKSRLVFKMFRKTKNMCGIKDIQDAYRFGASLNDGTNVLTGSYSANPINGFMYYLRFFNQSDSDIDISLTVKMSLYMTMTSREFNPIVKFISPP